MFDKTTYIEVNGEKVELIYNIVAMNTIGRKSGKSDVLVWLAESCGADKDKKVNVENADINAFIERICVIISAMANASIYKHNLEIAMNMKQGEKKQPYPDGYFETFLDISRIEEYQKKAISAIYKGMNVEIPNELKADIDEDLIEIEAEKKS